MQSTNNQQVVKEALKLLSQQNFDSLAFGIIDLKNKSFFSSEISAKNIISTTPYLYFDLASLTKPLTNSAVVLNSPQLLTPELNLLLNHRAGIVSGGLLSTLNWKEQLQSYTISSKPSDTLYSDYSSLRAMLEIEKVMNNSLKSLCSYYFAPEGMVHWLEFQNKDKAKVFTPESGYRNNRIIFREVHDNNAFNIKHFLSHAGLFATIDGLCQSLLNLFTPKNLEFISEQLNKHPIQDWRFTLGFDRVTDPQNTLAGIATHKNTFGHLGFTGTSFWVNLEQMKIAVILTNATQQYWYDRNGLNDLRKKLGSLIWAI